MYLTPVQIEARLHVSNLVPLEASIAWSLLTASCSEAAGGGIRSVRSPMARLRGRATPVRCTVAPPAHHHDWRSSDKVTFTVLKLDSDVNGASRTHRASRLRQLYLYGVGFCWNGEAELLLPGQRATAPRRCAPWAIGTPLDFPRPRHLAAAPRELSRPHRPR